MPPECFARRGETWSHADQEEVFHYLFTGESLDTHLAFARRTLFRRLGSLSFQSDDPMEALADYLGRKFNRLVVPRFDPERASFEACHWQYFKRHVQEWGKAVAGKRGWDSLKPGDEVVEPEPFASTRTTPADAAELNELLLATDECLQGLNERERAALMTSGEEEDAAAAAKALGMSGANMRTTRKRAREKLLRCLRPRGFSPPFF